MKPVFQRGFTLIELLVVIAIIGILAAVVLSSLNDARDGARNSSVQQTVHNIRTQAEVWYTEQGSYAGMCADGTDIDRLIDGAIAAVNSISAINITLASDQATLPNTLVCHITAGGTAYAISAPLINITGTQEYYCVDGSGRAVTSDTPLGASEVMCP